jgi:hypothetical protein
VFPVRYELNFIYFSRGEIFTLDTRVEAGSNTSTVTLRVVRDDENGSLKSETVKCGPESQGTQIRERLYKRQTRPLVREGAPQKQDRNCRRGINMWS